MVSIDSMRFFRQLAPLLSVVALAVLFFKLPETPNPFGIFGCKNCFSDDPYFTLLGAAYFAFLFAVSLLFPAFPSLKIARGGVIWAILLAATLTYKNLPNWCIACLVCHGCNLMIWMLGVLDSPRHRKSSSIKTRELLCLASIFPLVTVALFSNLNLTFMAYGYKTDFSSVATGLQVGEHAPVFNIQTIEGRSISNESNQEGNLVINFISPGCLYCQEQLPILNAVAMDLSNQSFRFVNVISQVSEELKQLSPNIEWVEDTNGHLPNLFKVLGFPTLFFVGSKGEIKKIIAGVPEHLHKNLLEASAK